LQRLSGNNGQVQISLRMAAREAATGRPEEFLAEIDIPFETTRVHRTNLIFRGENG
jgi:hypothetical protein